MGNAKSSALGSVVNNIVSLFGEIVGKIWSFLKTGVTTLKSVVGILSRKDTPLSIRIAEIGKTVVVGLAVANTAVLSEAINTALISAFPALEAMTVPIIGSVSGFIVELLLGILNGVIAGIVINKINKYIAKKQKSDLRSQAIDKNNQILRKQEIQIALGNKRLEVESKKIMKKIDNRHREANKIAQEALEEIFTPVPESDYNIAEMQADLEDLLK